MHSRFLLLFIVFSLNVSAQYTGYNMIQLSNWDNDDLPSLGSQQYSACWGWYDSTKNREYAIFGSIDSTYFFDVTDATKPVMVDVKAGKSGNSVWREYKTYSHYCYAAADAGRASLQIFDMSYLPDSVHTVYDSDSLVMRSHTLWVDGDRLYCNSVTRSTGASHAVSVLSLADPENPQLLGHIKPPIFDGSPAFVQCHDAFVRNDTLWCSGENAGVFIYDVANMPNHFLLGTIQEYPEHGYNHSGFVSGDGQTFVFTDENAGLGIKAFDISNMANIELQSVFRSNKGAVAHNPYFIGQRLFMSSYHDGVYVYDLTDPTDPKTIAWYDTYPQNGTSYGGFEGCWGVYPDLPSGNIIAIDMTNGLFMLRMDATASAEDFEVKDALLFPNPARDRFSLQFDADVVQDLVLELVAMDGKTLMTKKINVQSGWNSMEFEIPVHIQDGVYLLQLKGANTHICKKLAIR